jgi:hypothetical protein
MKAKYIFSIFIIISCIGYVNSQIIPPIKKVTLQEKDKTILNQHLSKYTVFTLDKKVLVDSLYKNGACKFQISIDEELDWTLDLQFNDMRSMDYKQTSVSDNGEVEQRLSLVNTFKGKTSNNQIARFTIDDNNFWGVILDDEIHYVIRPVKDYTKNATDENMVVYKSSDIISNSSIDYINDALPIPNNDESKSLKRDATKAYTSCTYYLEIATDADYEFYQAMGSNLTNTYSYIFSILNIIEGAYEIAFDMKFIINYQNVYTTSNTPYTSTDAYILLPQFKDNFIKSGAKRADIAHLFTGKRLDGNVAGIAFRGSIGAYGYSLSMYRTGMYATTAHEIGHNLYALDNPADISCLCGTSTASIMCQGQKDLNLWFCQQSIDEISFFIYNNLPDLGINIPVSLNLSGTLSGFNSYQAKQKIESTQIINSGFTSYEAGTEIELLPGFEVKAGAGLEININNGCW